MPLRVPGSPKLWVPLGLLAAGVLGALLLLATAPSPATVPPPTAIPVVRTVVAETRDVQIRIASYGTVSPRSETELVPEVSGRVEWVSPSLVSGGFFEEGDPLLRVDRYDYEVEVERARARLARAESQAALQAKALARQRELARRDVESASRLDDAINTDRVARATLREARAELAQAERDLDRTEIRAPYAGRVRQESVDVGQFVSRGDPVGRIYAVDWAEVRLPIRDEDLSFLELSLDGVSYAPRAAPEVVLRANFGGAEREWRGEVVRTEGEIDPRSRMVHVVARVADPYGRDARAGLPPFPVGLFVEAEILGRVARDVVVLPREALLYGGRVLVVDREDRLRFREVDVLRVTRDKVLVRAGLAPGERVSVSALDMPVEGTPVRPVPVGPPGSVTAEDGGAGASS